MVTRKDSEKELVGVGQDAPLALLDPIDMLIDWLIDRREGQVIPSPDTDGSVFQRTLISREINAIIEHADSLRSAALSPSVSVEPQDEETKVDTRVDVP